MRSPRWPRASLDEQLGGHAVISNSSFASAGCLSIRGRADVPTPRHLMMPGRMRIELIGASSLRRRIAGTRGIAALAFGIGLGVEAEAHRVRIIRAHQAP